MTDLNIHDDSQLMGIVVHDLKTPVSAVRGFLELIQQLGDLNDGQKKYLQRAHMALDRMERIIQSLLDFSHLQSGMRRLHRTDVNLIELITTVADFLTEIAHKRHITVHLPTDHTPIYVSADADLLGHVITNLLTNAIKYNREGGDVWVSVTQSQTEIRVDVRDSGIGIAPKDQIHVFDRFFRANRNDKSIEGTGLGLAICKTIIDLHGGRIWLASEVGVGSTFSFVLPLKAPHDGAGEASEGVDDDQQERTEKLDTDSTHDDMR